MGDGRDEAAWDGNKGETGVNDCLEQISRISSVCGPPEVTTCPISTSVAD